MNTPCGVCTWQINSLKIITPANVAVGELFMNNVVTLKLSKPASHQRRIKKLCEWIDANIDKPISWADLSEHSGMGHVDLQRAFTIYKKLSPMQWIRIRRIELMQTEMAKAYLNEQNTVPASLTHKYN